MPRALPLLAGLLLTVPMALDAGAGGAPALPAWALPPGLPALPGHADRGLALARALLDAAPDDGLAGAVASAEAVLRWRSGSAVDAQPAGVPALPGSAHALAVRLADQAGLALDPAARAALGRLADLPAPLDGALGEVLARFLDLDGAARAAFAPAWQAPMPAGADAGRPVLAPVAGGPGLGPVAAAEARFLRAVQGFADALGATPPALRAPGRVLAPPLLDLDLAGAPTLHDQDVLLLLDAGGHDVYDNNAGGNVLRLPSVPHPGVWLLPCWLLAGGGSPPRGLTAAAAAVDLGGDDTYGRADTPRCGANGGANLGSGLLLDANGNDTYTSAHRATNGGALLGTGLLVDGGGDDRYTAGSWGANGGAAGFFVGSDLTAQGALLDLGEGRDAYVLAGFRDANGGNGGAWFQGQGLLWDGGGDDRYEGGETGVNGGAAGGAGFLLDTGGHDLYLADPTIFGGASNGGGWGGAGFLWDRAGDDRYEAGHFGANGGGGGDGFLPLGGAGFLLDEAGDDTYVAGFLGANGGAAWLGAQGFLLDLGGDDAYLASDDGANGGGHFGGRGVLVDVAGDDRYEAGQGGVNGGAGGCLFAGQVCVVPVPAEGLLLDGGGRDVYLDQEGGSGDDRTVAPKGLAGAQVDAP